MLLSLPALKKKYGNSFSLFFSRVWEGGKGGGSPRVQTHLARMTVPFRANETLGSKENPRILTHMKKNRRRLGEQFKKRIS